MRIVMEINVMSSNQEAVRNILQIDMVTFFIKIRLSLFKRHPGENLRASIIKEQLTMESHHGPRFQKALLSLAKRTIREFGEEIPEDDIFCKTLKFELESFIR